MWRLLFMGSSSGAGEALLKSVHFKMFGDQRALISLSAGNHSRIGQPC